MVRPLLEHRAAWEPVAARIAEALADVRPPPEFRVMPLERLDGAWALGAIDGGSAMVLEGGGLAVGAVRTAALAWRSHAKESETLPEVEVRLLDDALARDLADALPGLPPPDGVAALLERLRAYREWQAALGLARRLRAGDVLVLDGPLAQHDWPAVRLAELARACGEGGVHLAGLCKSASAMVGGVPLLLAAARAARGSAEPWCVPLPVAPAGTRAFAVRFDRGARVFKVELLPSEDPAVVLGKLAPWTRDAGYPGYPYPLALAHNRCALDDAVVEDLAHALREAAGRQGVGAAAWEEVFGDFHEVLDRGV